MSATAINDTTIRIKYNKALATNVIPNSMDFSINSTISHPITRVVYDLANPNSILIYAQNTIFYNEVLTLNYSGLSLHSTDADIVPAVTNMFVLNKIPPRYMIPGKIESENYSAMSGIQTENCTDTGGGLDVGYTNAGDYLKYYVFVQTAGNYNLTMRIAGYGGKISLYYDDAINTALIGSVTFTSTGGWQNWQNFSLSVPLTAGSHTLKVYVDQEGFNFNYMNVALNPSALPSTFADAGFILYPNPANDEFTLVYKCKDNSARMDIFNLQGIVVFSDKFAASANITKKYNLCNFQKGVYLVKIIDGDKSMIQKLVVK